MKPHLRRGSTGGAAGAVGMYYGDGSNERRERAMADLGIGVVGASGRMGQMLVRTVTEMEGMRVVAAIERPGADALGRDAGEVAGIGHIGVAVGDDPAALFQQADAVLEFSAPAATTEHAGLAAQHGKIPVIGTTGLGAAEEAALAEAGARKR